MPQQRVSDIMRSCSSAVVPMSMRLREAAEVLLTHEVPLLVVVDEQQRFVGVLAESGVVRALLNAPEQNVAIRWLMSRHVQSVLPDVELNCVLPNFRSSCHTVVPVLDAEWHVQGLLHRRDVVRSLLTDDPRSTGHADHRHMSGEGHQPRGPHYLKPDPPTAPENRNSAGGEHQRDDS